MQIPCNPDRFNCMIEILEPEPLPRLAVIGGGTGSYTLLKDLKNYTPELSALVNMSDDGGSSGRLRDELGVLPPGDVRQCLVALSECESTREVFSYRFGDGDLEGHSLGNLILSGLEKMSGGDFNQAVKRASYLLRVTGQVLPMTLDKHDLMMQDGDETIRGEFNIGHRPIKFVGAEVYLDPAARINPEAEEAIGAADMIVIAPGNLYGSILPALAVDGVRQALADSTATKLMVANLVNKPGQTDDWCVVDYIRKIEEYTGEGSLDAALFNTAAPPQDLLERYASEGELPVQIHEAHFNHVRAKMIGRHLLADTLFVQDGNDTSIQRTLIRHDGDRVAQAIMEANQILAAV